MEYWQVKELIVIGIGSMAVLVPVVGITARLTLGPLIDKFARIRGREVDQLMREVGELRMEVSRLGELNAGLETRIERLRDGAEFDRQLGVRARNRQSEA